LDHTISTWTVGNRSIVRAVEPDSWIYSRNVLFMQYAG
jgi:hypothetical protein